MADEIPTSPAASPYDREKITDRVKKKWDQWQHGRESFVSSAYLNILFFRGKQWVEFDRTAPTFWRPIRRPGMPMPVTNRYARVMNAHISMLARFEPSLTFAPGSHDAEDRAAADVASRAIEVIQDEVDMTTHRQALAKWVGLTGGAWRETGYDPDPVYGTVDVPMNVCPRCQAQEPIQPMMPTPPAVDALGNAPLDPMVAGGPLCADCQVPMAEQLVAMPKGRMYVDECSVFEMFFDPSITTWSKQRAYLRQKAVDTEVSKARWKHALDPETIRADSMGGTNQYAETLPTLGPNLTGTPRQMLGVAARPTNTKTTENYYYELPSEDYPEGVLAVFLGKKPDQFVTAGPLYTYFEGEDGSKTYFLPHVFFPQEEVPGSAWPKTVASDLVPVQIERNKAHAKIIMWESRMANHVWLLPQGANVRNLTGEFGQIVEYNPLVGGVNAKPERLAGHPLTPGMMERLQQLDHELDELAIVSEVMSGNRPAGISAGIALQILKERGETQFGPMFIKWNHAEAQWAKQALAIARRFWTEERLRKIKGRDGAWEVQKFLGADLRSNIDVVPEAGITLPRSTMTARAELEQLAANGVLQPASNPAHQRAFLKEFGKLYILEGLEKDTRNAIKENEAFEALARDPRLQTVDLMALKQQVQMAQAQGWPAPQIVAAAETFLTALGFAVPRLKPAIDGHPVHADEHRTFAKEERFDTYPEVVQLLIELHTAAHDFLTGQQMMAAQQARHGTTQQAGFLARPGPNPGSPPSTSPMRGASSQAGMDGQNREMERRAGSPVG